MVRAATAMTAPANPHPHPHPRHCPLVPDGELLVLGSHDTNVAIATVHCSGNVQGSCPCFANRGAGISFFRKGLRTAECKA
jgi:hypothetical protein